MNHVMKKFALLLLSLTLTSCGGTDSGNPSIADTRIGNIQAKDIPTIFYDITDDTIGESSASLSSSSFSTLSSGNNRQAAISEEEEVNGEFGGKAILKLDVRNSAYEGLIGLLNFRNRQGIPAVSSGQLNFDLDVQSSSITGSIIGKDIVIEEKAISFTANYDLYLDGDFWRGKITGSITLEEGSFDFEYDYDTPIITSISLVALDANQDESADSYLQAGNIVKLKLFVYSNAPVNWLNSMWSSPTGNIHGGGSGQSYCKLGDCGVYQGGMREIARGFWEYYDTQTVSTYQPSGIYTRIISVENAAKLESFSVEDTIEVKGGLDNPSAPAIHSASVTTSSLGGGTEGYATLHVVARSTIPVDWLNSSMSGPNGNIFGGGSGQSFTSCNNLQSSGHPCEGLGSDYWYTTKSQTLSGWSPNGQYSFNNISVQNAADLSSSNYSGNLNFSISGNNIATTPTITDIQLLTANGNVDINGGCLEVADLGSDLDVKIVVTISSNAPVDWLSTLFTGPTATLNGGGSGISATDLGGNSWQVVKSDRIQAVNFAPKGTYYYSNISVENEGDLESSVWSGALSFQLQDTCP